MALSSRFQTWRNYTEERSMTAHTTLVRRRWHSFSSTYRIMWLFQFSRHWLCISWLGIHRDLMSTWICGALWWGTFSVPLAPDTSFHHLPIQLKVSSRKLLFEKYKIQLQTLFRLRWSPLCYCSLDCLSSQVAFRFTFSGWSMPVGSTTPSNWFLSVNGRFTIPTSARQTLKL